MASGSSTLGTDKIRMDIATINSVWPKVNDQLLSFVNKRVKDSDAAKDIVQDVYLKVHEGSDKLRDSDKVVQWIYQITRNTIIDYFRKGKRLKSADEMQFAYEASNEENELLSGCLAPLINTLPEKYRDAIVLSEIEGMSQKELAEKLDISYSGAKSRVQRGREKLKDAITQCCTIKTDVYGNIIERTPNGGDCSC